METRSIELTTRLTKEDVAGVIEALVEGLKEGCLHVQKSGESLNLAVPRVLDLSVNAVLSEKKASFGLEVSWQVISEEEQKAREDATTLPDGAVVENVPAKTQKKTSARKLAVKEAGRSVKEAAKATKSAAKSIAKATKTSSKAAALSVESTAKNLKRAAKKTTKKTSGIVSATVDILEDSAEKAVKNARAAVEKAIDTAHDVKTDASRIVAEQAEKLATKKPGGKIIDTKAEEIRTSQEE